MSGNNDISLKIDMAVTACKTIYRVCSSIVSSQTNISLDINKRFDNIEKQLAELKEEIQKTDKLLTGGYHIYTDCELYNIKQSMSWKKLSQKTNIPLSTLQYRVRRYLKQNGEKLMINFTINGKNFNNEDMNLLICYDSVKDFTEMKMYCDHEEIQLDDNTADIDVTVNITRNGLLEKFERNRDMRASIDLINRALVIIKRETMKIHESDK